MMSSTMKHIYLVFCIFSISEARFIKETEDELSPFELDEFLNGTFKATTWTGLWISDESFIFINNSGINEYNVGTNTTETMLDHTVMANYTNPQISFSPDRSYALFRFNMSSVFRHSTSSLYQIYDIAEERYYDIAKLEPLQLVAFAPKGHGLIYVKDNNIYYLDSPIVSEPLTITTIGKKGIIYCGVADWVYEEEVLSATSASWFSPEATYLAYAVFDDTNVKNFSYAIYGEPGSKENQYPTEAQLKYPKVGTPNPLVTIYLYDFTTKETVEFQFPSTIHNKDTNDYIFYDMTWISDTEVAMISTNRVQNESIIIRCKLDGSCIEEQSYKEEKGWLTPRIPKYSKNGKRRLEILPQIEGDDKYDHLVLTDIDTNTQIRLTNGRLVVLSIYGWDEARGLIYYKGTVADTPSQQHVYVVSEGGESGCLTCDFIVDGSNCTFADAAFSKNYSYYVKTCLGPNPPLLVIVNTNDPSDSFVWEENKPLREKLKLKSMPVVKNMEVPISNNFTARVRLFLPPKLNENSLKKYPAVVNTYGGPDSNQILDAYSTALQYYMVTNREYIYILIDGRGTGRDGQNKMFQMYRKFGTVEIEDQIYVTRYLQERLHYIDSTKTGIWGWSYGGFASSWILAKDKDHVFNFALAIAPVTSFIYYDSIYTERYMGLPTPEDNELGYNNSDVTRMAKLFEGRNYFIIHGSGDDNVHYQNSMLLVKALEYADIDFRQQTYPDEAHSLSGVSKHLYHTIDKYWANCFDQDATKFPVHKKENGT
uniref:Venom dipeptidyl peptidase 4 n=1 Tax=Leptinotarsa decemlineata TaxID=7539 RepID=V9PBD6_LEPDE|nr:dipeptidyl peptidase [Leptinotarsa decemlineata]